MGQRHQGADREVIDSSALRVNQAGIVATVVLAFLGSIVLWPAVYLIPALAVVLIAGTLNAELALFKQLYFRVLKPRGLVQPRPVEGTPQPHNFAQGLGGSFLLIASLLLPILPALALRQRECRVEACQLVGAARCLRAGKRVDRADHELGVLGRPGTCRCHQDEP